MSATCPVCSGNDARDATQLAGLTARLTAALDADDLDAAIEMGLLRFEPDASAACERCRPALDRLVAARDDRRNALAARERYRQRNARLEQRAQARASKRLANTPAAADASKPTLPAAAAAALARAKAKAAERK